MSAGRTNIDQAVILAAGAGMRIRDSISVPKGFIELEGKVIIKESLDALAAVGIKQVVLVNGYRPEFYEELKSEYSFLKTVHNAKYMDSGSMYSLYLARESIADESFLLLESDLIYEKRALMELFQEERDHAVLASGWTGSGDEVYIDAKDTGRGTIANITKIKSETQNAVGELVGLSRISPVLFRDMLRKAEDLFKKSLHQHYETDILAQLAREGDVFYRLVEDLVWSEIDDISHLERARTEVYPAIKEKNAAGLR